MLLERGQIEDAAEALEVAAEYEQRDFETEVYSPVQGAGVVNLP